MDWIKQIEKLEEELQKLTERENRIAERTGGKTEECKRAEGK